LDLLVRQAQLVRLALQVLKDHKVFKVMLVHKDQLVQPVLQDQQDRKVHKVHKVLLEIVIKQHQQARLPSLRLVRLFHLLLELDFLTALTKQY
jgi:fatty acid/phospholipid biosynthesis enzyme